MNEFNAKQAKRLVDNYFATEIGKILEEIKEEASKGNSKLYVEKSLSKETLNSIKELGFRIVNHPSIAIQKENLHYTICW